MCTPARALERAGLGTRNRVSRHWTGVITADEKPGAKNIATAINLSINSEASRITMKRRQHLSLCGEFSSVDSDHWPSAPLSPPRIVALCRQNLARPIRTPQCPSRIAAETHPYLLSTPWRPHPCSRTRSASRLPQPPDLFSARAQNPSASPNAKQPHKPPG